MTNDHLNTATASAEPQKENKPEENTGKSHWVKFCIYTIFLLLFLYWIKSLLGLVVLPFLFDAYITHKIPWNWWKHSKNKTVRIVMSWVDPIVFALVAVYFVNLYFFQNYVIPSSSLEKSLLTGDYLLVSKVSYGPRGPITPLHMPLTGHTLPLLGTKSYFNSPHWNYKRAPGLGKIKQGDIVVFNYPAGDTVAANFQDTEYYTICYKTGEQLLPYNRKDLTPEEQLNVFQQQYEAGRQYVLQNPERFGKVLARPVDMREHYVKRCVGLPGQMLKIRKGIVYTDRKPMFRPKEAQQSYIVTLKSELPEDFCKEYSISVEDRSEIIGTDSYNVRRMPLTERALAALQKRTDLVSSVVQAPPASGTELYPHNKETGWTCNDYGPVWIPKAGKTLRLTLSNLPIYQRPIEVYEGNKLEVKNGKIYINGKVTDAYTFKMDYYWMMGDNRDNSADSRFWGFVPEDHIVGKPIFIWLSLNKDYGWFSGKLRFNRMFRLVDNMK